MQYFAVPSVSQSLLLFQLWTTSFLLQVHDTNNFTCSLLAECFRLLCSIKMLSTTLFQVFCGDCVFTTVVPPHCSHLLLGVCSLQMFVESYLTELLFLMMVQGQACLLSNFFLQFSAVCVYVLKKKKGTLYSIWQFVLLFFWTLTHQSGSFLLSCCKKSILLVDGSVQLLARSLSIGSICYMPLLPFLSLYSSCSCTHYYSRIVHQLTERSGYNVKVFQNHMWSVSPYLPLGRSPQMVDGSCVVGGHQELYSSLHVCCISSSLLFHGDNFLSVKLCSQYEAGQGPPF